MNVIERRPRRWLRPLAIGTSVLVAGAVIGWASATVLTPPQDVLASTAFTTAEVVTGEVGSSITLNTVAEWTPAPVGTNLAAGTVTTVDIEAGAEVTAGTRLYSVNLRPVVVGQGAIPAFRALSSGTSGQDVVQLQSLLASLGHYRGAVDGRFGGGTASAVRAWQKALGLPQDGAVQAGDIIYVPTLPTRVALDTETITRGAALSGGEAVVQGLGQSPAFFVPVTDAQASLMPAGTRVEITSPEGSAWEGSVVDRVSDENGGIRVLLDGPEDTPICGDECAQVPVTGQTFLTSRIIIVESVTGLTVPSAALLSKADGSIVVIDGQGVEFAVTVITSARGLSIIEGVDAGMRVRVPAAEG